MAKNNSSTQTKGNGMGSTKRVSQEEHDARRRAKKASQNANARANAINKHKNGESYLDGLYNDRREEIEERKRVKREFLERQAQRQLEFRLSQAERASEAEPFTKLKKNSIAHKMAVEVIMSFPTVQPKPGMKRTDAAVEQAYAGMSDEEALHKKAIELGVNAAKRALSIAYRQLTTEQAV